MSMLESSALKKGQSDFIRRSSAIPSSGASARKLSTAEPKPNQPGRATRLCPQEKLQGMARKSSIFWLAFLEAGREPMLSWAISAIGVAEKKYSVKPGVS